MQLHLWDLSKGMRCDFFRGSRLLVNSMQREKRVCEPISGENLQSLMLNHKNQTAAFGSW